MCRIAYAFKIAYAINDAHAEAVTWRQNGLVCALKIAYAFKVAYAETRKQLEKLMKGRLVRGQFPRLLDGVEVKADDGSLILLI
jgi:hypothetical protein